MNTKYRRSSSLSLPFTHFYPNDGTPKPMFDSDGMSIPTYTINNFIIPEFADEVISKLKRVKENFDDGQDTDVGKDWLDALTTIGLLSYSKGRYEITQTGEYVIEEYGTMYRNY